MQGRIYSELNFETKYSLVKEEILKASKLGFLHYQLKYSVRDHWSNILSNQGNIDGLVKLCMESNINISSINIDITNSSRLDEAILELNKIQKIIDSFNIQDINIAWIEKENNINSSKMVIEELDAVVNFFKKDVKINIETSRAAEQLFVESKFLQDNMFFTLDIGNMTFYKDRPAFVLANIPEKIGQIHLKDRTQYGQSTFFGSGDVDFELFLNTLKGVEFSGLVVFEGFYNNNKNQVDDNYKLNAQYYDFMSSVFNC